jgi:hypothetical protein
VLVLVFGLFLWQLGALEIPGGVELAIILLAIKIRGEYTRLPVRSECSDESELSDEQAGDEADTLPNNPLAIPLLDILQYLNKSNSSRCCSPRSPD